MKNNTKAHIGLIGANLLYGLNYVIAKGIMPDYMSPRGVIFLRVLGAVIVFNIIHLLFVKEKIERKDLKLFAACGLFGIAINQIFFFEGLNLTTPINASLIMTTGPIFVLVFSFFILKEKISLSKLLGIILGTTGASILILLGGKLAFNANTSTGNLLVFINCMSYALYLVLAKPVMVKYNPITVMKWVFNFGFIYILPFCIHPILSTNFEIIPTGIWLSIFYVVIGTTILAYLFNNYALRIVSPIVSGSYMYSQPAIAAIVSIVYLHEKLTLIKILAAVLIFAGLYFVSIRKQT